MIKADNSDSDDENALPPSYFDQKIEEFKTHKVLFHKNLSRDFDFDKFKKK